jgi:uncharacterized membrane protein YfcA
MDHPVTVIALGAVLAGFVQGLSGFAFGLVAMSIWAWSVEPRLAAALAVFGALTGQVVAAVTVRRGFDVRRLAPFIAGGLLGVPLGLWLLPRLDASLFQALLGALLVTWCPAMLAAARLPRVDAGGRVGDVRAGLAGGLMGGVGGFSGPVPTLWCLLRGFERDAARAVVQNFNLAMLSVAFAGYLAGGFITVAMAPLLALVAMAVLVPVLLGARLYIGLSEAAFRRVVLVLLTLAGIALLASALPVLWRR